MVVFKLQSQIKSRTQNYFDNCPSFQVAYTTIFIIPLSKISCSIAKTHSTVYHLQKIAHLEVFDEFLARVFAQIFRIRFGESIKNYVWCFVDFVDGIDYSRGQNRSINCYYYLRRLTFDTLSPQVMSCYARKKKEKLHETFVSLKINSRDHYYPCNFLQPIKFDNLGLRQKDILPQVTIRCW